MNMKELVALVLKQGQDQDLHTNLIAGLKQEIEGRDQRLTAQEERITQLSTALDAARRELAETTVFVSTADARMGELEQITMPLDTRVEKLETMVYARNSSAPTKRNMTDDDARRVMTGDLKDQSHKDAAASIGLTYAQVYSCRGEFTFKHVHKELRDNGVDGKPWVNPWAK